MKADCFKTKTIDNKTRTNKPPFFRIHQFHANFNALLNLKRFSFKYRTLFYRTKISNCPYIHRTPPPNCCNLDQVRSGDSNSLRVLTNLAARQGVPWAR